jgi:hypothetical protein
MRANATPAMAPIAIPAIAPPFRWPDALLLLLLLPTPLLPLPCVVVRAVGVDVTVPLLCIELVLVTGVLEVVAGIEVDVVHVDGGPVTAVASVWPAARVEPSGVQPAPPGTPRPNIWGPQHHEPLTARIGALICGIESAKQLLYIYSPSRPTGSAHPRHIIDILHAVFVTGWTTVFAACGEARKARRAASRLISSTAHGRIRRAAGWFSQGEATGKIAVCSFCKTEHPERRCQRREQHLGGEWFKVICNENFQFCSCLCIGGKIRRLF